ncbi:hypothetical protein NM688_g8084 [Phlebia brevispora]|uniref:Uncharacterized protein n=1 Tax=Phlebia brevispora TaxID=194682 RepID=A0ACC1RXJ4_9APHY|nr:hypothetical protein NM688_g8084 [Phlebia brevispora]
MDSHRKQEDEEVARSMRLTRDPPPSHTPTAEATSRTKLRNLFLKIAITVAAVCSKNSLDIKLIIVQAAQLPVSSVEPGTRASTSPPDSAKIITDAWDAHLITCAAVRARRDALDSLEDCSSLYVLFQFLFAQPPLLASALVVADYALVHSLESDPEIYQIVIPHMMQERTTYIRFLPLQEVHAPYDSAREHERTEQRRLGRARHQECAPGTITNIREIIVDYDQSRVGEALRSRSRKVGQLALGARCFVRPPIIASLRVQQQSFGRMFATILLTVAILAILHAAFSTYEHLSHLKALGRPEGSLPADIIIEAVLALILGTIGATMRSPQLREITWRSEMKERPLDEINPRMSFKTFAQQAGLITAEKDESKQ